MRAIETFRVTVVTEDRLLREGVTCILTAERAEVVVTDPGSARGEPLAEIILLDSRLERALDRCGTLRLSIGTMVILIEAPEDDAWALKALEAGARGILTRRAGSEELLGAIEVVKKGQIWAPRRLLVARLDQLANGPAAATVPEAELEQRLSVREREVFRQAAAGLGNKELADRLAISQATVKVHLTHIFRKLGLSGRAELAAAYHGLLSSRSRARTAPDTPAALHSVGPDDVGARRSILPKA